MWNYSKDELIVILTALSRLLHEALRVSAAALFSADLWRLSRTALPAQLLLSTGGAGELDAGRVRGHRGGSDQRRERAGRTLQPQQRPEPQQSTLGRVKHNGADQEASFLKSSDSRIHSSHVIYSSILKQSFNVLPLMFIQ
ncbi:hypothetical protein M9458_050953 [Cirrhinus mrigala]|uniref:Uncharacterized protein n=1 Tax=Cirrhinus mrigala TaxID=683832 RepID=A0ABD0MF41_CIRMR